MDSDWLGDDGAGKLTLRLHVQPGARRTESAGLHGDALKLRLAAPPVDGRANECLIAFLAQQAGVARAAVELASGAGSRRKVVRIHGVGAAGMQRLRALATPG